MRAKKRAKWARLFGAQFAVVTLFRKVLDLRPPPSLLSRGLPITKSMDMLRRSGACANSSSYLSRQKTRFAEARTCEVKRHFHISYTAPSLPPPPPRPLKCSLPLTPEEDLIFEGLSGADARYTKWIGTLSKVDDDGSENLGNKMNLRAFRLNRVYLDPVNLSNAGDFSWSWILKDFIHAQKLRKENSSSYVHVVHKTSN